MSGNVVHEWTIPYRVQHAVLLPTGNILMNCNDGKALPGRPGFPPFHLGAALGWLYEMDWDGNVVFKYFDPNMHHDFDKLDNGNYIYLGFEQVPKELQKKVRGGRKGSEHPGGVMWNDYIAEVTSQGKEVWRWSANDHFDPDIDIIGPLYGRNEWGHSNDVDGMENGNIIFDAKHTDTVYIIDKKTKEIIWRWGASFKLDKETGRLEYRGGKGVDDALGGMHAAYEIQTGFPGAGNIMLYDNGVYAGKSRAVEVDIKTNKVAWDSRPPGKGGKSRGHFSEAISNAERLPNGNTIICSGNNARYFEITPQKQVVWEFVSPYADSAFRVHRYGPDYCPQFKDLPPARGPAVVMPDVNSFRMPAAAVAKAPPPGGDKGGPPPGGKKGPPPGGKKGPKGGKK
ncbi:MAG: aryl-sulfate sulfotransferase [Deltaproteobacteria bacterium]|nr:aryl-sulfate sulfotransferase [Deltaproteobacteria bacterium]